MQIITLHALAIAAAIALFAIIAASLASLGRSTDLPEFTDVTND